ncbi:hypothetical protein ABZW10_33165 [Kitasatospora sp. NPDC004723]|uniref:hypothetical protein n=1 Tax=Kitasatospora sp. NPDC004723 TaxID=3154288 RepID=UPI0033BEE857
MTHPVDPATLAALPPTPLYTITLTTHGTAQIDGEEVLLRQGDDVHRAALAEIVIKAAYLGRPVRVNAKDPSGVTTPLVVHLDGSVTTLPHPHPAPARPAPAPAAPLAQQPAPEPAAASGPARPAAPAPPLPAATVQQPAYTRLPAPGEPYQGQALPEWAHPAPAPAPAPPVATAPPSASTPSPTPPAPASADLWAAPFPEEYRGLLDRLREEERAGHLDRALDHADVLESILEKLHGPEHPLTVNALALRGWLLIRQEVDSALSTETLLLTVQRRRAGGAPEEETRKVLRDAYRSWWRLATDDPAYARETAEQLVDLLGDDRHAEEVIKWLESGTVGTAAR